ncbi:MAG: sugar ABC transporter permease [Ardenticatenaceae bacterium]|nr:sugar ABC transporter permease [Ardenticatenaceae bacterium]
MMVSQLPSSQESFRNNRLFRALLSVGTAILSYFVLRWGIAFMKDREAPERFLLTAYERLGLETRLAYLQSNGLDPLTGKLMITAVALLIGIGGVWLLLWLANDLISYIPFKLREQIRPFVFVGPAIMLLATFLIYPVLNTIYTSLSEDILELPDIVPEQYWAEDDILLSLTADAELLTFERYLINTDQVELVAIEANERKAWLLLYPQTMVDSESEVERRVFTIRALGFHNYRFAVTSPELHIAFRNNLLWLIIGTGGSVAIGLIIATLVDRIKREALAKSFIFLPLAISFVGASVIWKFVYAWQPGGRAQIGLLNALVTQLGIEPVPWLLETNFNTYALIVIMVWLQTGFAMVVLSAALKGVPNEVIEAARIDGATELQLFFNVIIPMIRGSIITVGTTIFIAILKVFDIVYVMTSGKFETEVVANRMFVEMFTFRNFGRASSLAVILLIVVVPIMVINIRNLRQQGINR